jgi:hypothetical protein
LTRSQEPEPNLPILAPAPAKIFGFFQLWLSNIGGGYNSRCKIKIASVAIPKGYKRNSPVLV